MKTLNVIILTGAEVQSGHDRVQWAENLILQLPPHHEGRNSWLLNYGKSEEAQVIRNTWELQNNRKLEMSDVTESVKPVS